MKLIRVFRQPVLDGLLNIVIVIAGMGIIGYVAGVIYALVENLFL